jgi:hypothetical protein
MRFGLLLEQRSMTAVILALGITCGIAVPGVAKACEPIALHSLFLVVVLSLVAFARIPAEELVRIDHKTIRIVAWQQLVVPGLVMAASIIARISENVILLLLVTACAGSLFASPALAQILKLDRQRALQGMLLSTLVMPVSLYVFLALLRGDHVSLDFKAYAWRALIFLVLPLVLFAIYRAVAVRLSTQASDRIESFSRWGTIAVLLVFGIGMMHPVAMEIRTNPTVVVFHLALAVGMSVALFSLTAIVMYRYGAIEALTGSVLGAFRNIGLGFALIGDMVGPELDVYVGVSMLPIFIGPVIMQLVLADVVDRRQALA